MFNPLFLKIGLGGAVVTGAGTTGIIYREKIKTFVENQFSKSNVTDTKEESNAGATDVTEHSETKTTTTVDSETTQASAQQQSTTIPETVVVQSSPSVPPVTSSTYVIVKTKTVADTDITNELYAGETKNFKCVLTNETNKEDDACSIFSIAAHTDNKLNNLKDIKDSQTKATKAKITANTFFKLTISDSVLASAKWDGTQTIDIVSTTEATKDKKYGSFTLQYKITDDLVVEGKTNLIIGKITKKDLAADLTDGPTFKCLLTGESEKKVCSLFKIDSVPTEIKDVVLIGVKAATKKNTDYEINNWYVIDLKSTSDKKNISDFKTKNVIVVNQTTTEEALATFEFQAALSETEEAFSESNVSKIIFA